MVTKLSTTRSHHGLHHSKFEAYLKLGFSVMWINETLTEKCEWNMHKPFILVNTCKFLEDIYFKYKHVHICWICTLFVLSGSLQSDFWHKFSLWCGVGTISKIYGTLTINMNDNKMYFRNLGILKFMKIPKRLKQIDTCRFSGFAVWNFQGSIK